MEQEEEQQHQITLQKHLTAIKSIQDVVGPDVSVEKIKYFLQGAEWDIQTALNHILNDIEKETSQCKRTTHVADPFFPLTFFFFFFLSFVEL